MANDSQVIVDGATAIDPERRKQPSKWLLPILTFILGLGLGVIVVPATPDSADVEEDGGGNLVAPVEETLPQVTNFGLGEQVAGFVDAFVTVTASDRGELTRMFWPFDGPLREVDIGLGEEAALDRSGQVMAKTQTVPGLDGAVLSVGRVSDLVPVTAGVTSFKWHDSKAGNLGYTAVVDGRWQLWSLSPDSQSTLVAEGLVEQGRLAAWGDWGWAIQAATEVVLLTPNGEIKTTHSGTALTSDGVGWVLIANERLELVSAGGGVQRLEMAPDRVGMVAAASFSPDGERIAVAGNKGVIVFPISGDGEIAELVVARANGVAWSSDSRFLAVPMARGVSIFDLETVGRETVLSTTTVLDIKMLAVSS